MFAYWTTLGSILSRSYLLMIPPFQRILYAFEMNFRQLSYLCFSYLKWVGLSLLIYHSLLAIKSQVLYFTMFYNVLLYFTTFTIFYNILLYFPCCPLLYFTIFYYILQCFTMFCYILLYFIILWVLSNHNKQKQIHDVKRTSLSITIII